MFFFCILVVFIVDVIVGVGIGSLDERSEARGFVGLSISFFKENFGLVYRGGENFFFVFVVFFLVVIGILVGVNIFGDFKDV